MFSTSKMDNFVYQNIKEVFENGVSSENARPRYANGEVANSRYITDVFIKFDLQKELPISSLRPIYTRLAIEEMFWIYQDQTSDLSFLEERGVNWWSDWKMEDGTIGARYGHTVGKWELIDKLLDGLRKNPFNRRNIINLWQEEDLSFEAPLPPCAFQIIFDVRRIGEDIFLDASLTQRSSDFLTAGMGINQMQYVALQMMIAKDLGFKVGTFSWHVMNLHIYDRHIDAGEEILRRYEEEDRSTSLDFGLSVEDGTPFYKIESSSFYTENYNPIKPQIKLDMAI